MAPEQIQGKEVDHRADIFSLGVVFYEMLTRRKPFQGENLTAVTHKIVYEPFTPAEEIIKDLPPGLTAIMSRCLEKDPNRRYPRAAEIAAELRRSGSNPAEALDEDDDDTSATQEVAEETFDQTAPRPPEAETQVPGWPAPSPKSPPPPPASPPSTVSSASPAAAGAAGAPGAQSPAASRAALSPAAEGASPAPGPPAPGPASPTGTPAPALPAPPAPPAPMMALPVSSLSGSTKVSAALRRIRSQRLVQYGLVGLAALTVVTLLALWATGRTEPRPPAPAGPTAQEQRQLDLQAALAEARLKVDGGDLQGALAALARAQQLEPGSPAALALRAEVERVSLDLASAAEREQRVSEGLILAREEYAKRRYETAIAAANGVLELVPEHPEAVKLATDSAAALARQKERERAQKSAREAATQAAVESVPTPAAPPNRPAPAVAATAVAADATIEIDFYSEVSEGVLTIYSGESQIFREPFKFVKKTGFLRTEKIAGAIGAQRTLPAGAVALRVYVSLPGKPTKATMVEGTLAGGSTRRLVVRVDAESRATAQLE